MPSGVDTTDNLEAAYYRQRQARRADQDRQELEAYIAAQRQPQPIAEEPYDPFKKIEKGAKEGVKAVGRAALDIGHGLIETPIQAPTGFFLDASNATLQAFHELAGWLDENVADLGSVTYSPETGLQFTSAKRAKQMAQKIGLAGTLPFQLPVPAEADSVTGGYIRQISKFLGGFLGAGKITGLKGATGVARIGVDALHGAMADATLFGPHEKRLANLIQEIPGLENPITEYLAASPDDSAAEGRFKNALEGLGLGVATDGLTHALRLIRAGRMSRMAAEAPRATEPMARAPLRVVKRGEVEALLSDRPVRQTLKLVEEGEPKPEEVIAAGKAKPGPPGGPTPLSKDQPIPIETPHVMIDQGEVYINWARIDTDEDVKALMRDLADARKSEIEKARRGVQTWEQTKLNAQQQDAWKILTERRKGEPLGAEQSLAVRELWVTSAEKLKELAELAATNPSDANLFAFRKMVAIHNTIQRQVIAARTETARALQSWRIPAGSDVELARGIGDLLQYMGGDQVSRAMAEKVVQLTRDGAEKELDAFIETSAWAKTRAAISAAWYFSLLSGPHTHMRNMLSNTFVAAQQIYERKTANLIGQMLGEENVARGESLAMLYGTIEGTKDALRITAKGRRILREASEVALQGAEGREAAHQMLEAGKEEFGTFYRAAATGESGMGLGKLETPAAGVLSSERWALDPESGFGRAMDLMDAVISTPGRALMAEDELFKTIGYRSELHALAQRKVAQEIAAGTLENTPEAMKRRAVEIIADPDETMRLAAQDAAAYRTFTQQMGPWVRNLSNAFNDPNASPFLRGMGIILWPFRRTPANIFKYGFERTPLAPLFSHVKADLAAGGARRDMALARMATGSLLLLAAMDLAMGGHTTGAGPANPNQRATLRRMGIQPNSIKVGDRYFSYRGTEPISQTIGIASNIVEILANTDWSDDDSGIEEMLIAAIMAIAYQTTSATYMQGLSDFLDVMGDPVRYGEHYFQKLAGSFVPTGIAQITRAIDPNMRAVESMIDSIRRRTPGLSDDLPYARDAWGREIPYESGLGRAYDILVPLYSKKLDPTPIDKELERLELWIGRPAKRASFNAEMIDEIPGRGSLTIDLGRFPKSYDRYLELQGHALTASIYGVPIDSSNKGLLDTLNLLVTGGHPLSGLYQTATDGSDGGKAQMIRKIRDKFTHAARVQLLLEFPELRQEVISRMPHDWMYQ